MPSRSSRSSVSAPCGQPRPGSAASSAGVARRHRRRAPARRRRRARSRDARAARRARWRVPSRLQASAGASGARTPARCADRSRSSRERAKRGRDGARCLRAPDHFDTTAARRSSAPSLLAGQDTAAPETCRRTRPTGNAGACACRRRCACDAAAPRRVVGVACTSARDSR